MVHKREPPEGEEDSFEPTEEEAEEGPEPLAPAEGDAEVRGLARRPTRLHQHERAVQRRDSHGDERTHGATSGPIGSTLQCAML